MGFIGFVYDVVYDGDVQWYGYVFEFFGYVFGECVYVDLGVFV